MPANAVTATANYGDKAYLFALENCTADKESAKFGEQVTFTADEVIGKRFDSWNIKGVDDLTGLDLTKSPLTRITVTPSQSRQTHPKRARGLRAGRWKA